MGKKMDPAYWARPVKNAAAEPVGDQVRLYQEHMPWPSDVAAYYAEIDTSRGIPPVKLCLGYGWKKADGTK